MKLRYVCLALIILSFAFLAPSPAVAQEQPLNSSTVTPIAIGAEAGYLAREEGYLSEREYADSTLRVRVETDRYLDTDMWIAHIQIAHPSQLRAALADRYGSQKVMTAEQIAKRKNAVTAINGDYYSYVNYGVVVRQGQLHRNKPNPNCDILLIDDQGNLHALLNADAEAFDQAYQQFGGVYDKGGRIVNAFTFGPTLVLDGKQAHEAFTRPDKSENKKTQRTVFAQVAPLSYLFVICEGPESPESTGLTLQEMTDYLLPLGCQIAYNLDGGSSSTLVLNNKKINSLSTRKNRPVSDIIYFSTGEVTVP